MVGGSVQKVDFLNCRSVLVFILKKRVNVAL
jgi:hypothetical protein